MPIPIRSIVRAITAALIGCATPGALAQIDPRSEIVYHIMPIAWRDSDNDAALGVVRRFGDFQGMFPSPAYHGYQHGRADQINPWFGTEAQFIEFVEAAHARGIKVFLDFVVYGISHNSPWFQSAFGNPGSIYDTWLAFTNGGNTQYQGYTFNTWNGAFVGFTHWDLRNPAAFALNAEWGKKWLDPNNDGDFSDGVDGYRLDHVWTQYGSGPDGWGYNLDDFWEPWKAELQSVNPDVFIFAEQADWGITGASLLTAFDAAMTKPLEFAIRDGLNNADAARIANAAAAAWNSLPPDRAFMGIVGDHDVDLLMSVLGSSTNRAKAAAAILMTHPFVPMIYYGDELGMRGTKGNFGSDANDIPFREPFKWNAVAGPPMSNYWILNNQAYTNRVSQNNDGVSVEEQTGVSGSMLETYRSLIALRTGNEALTHGGYFPVPTSSNRIYAFVRQTQTQSVLVVVSCSTQSTNVTLDLSAFTIPGGQTVPFNLWTGNNAAPVTTANKSAYPMTLSGHSFAILDLDLDTYAPPVGLVDGVGLPTDFPAPIATQDTPTSLGDNLSELNQLFGVIDGDYLRIGISGNLATDATGLALLIDAVAGGQSTLDIDNLSPPPGGPNLLTGTVLDAGFVPEAMIFANASGGTIYVDQYTLLTAGDATKQYRGAGAVNAGNGFLSGGTNPNGLEYAISNANTSGVTGSSVANAALATSGFEIAIPLADLGLAPGHTDPIGVLAFLMRSNGVISSQVLPPIGGSATDLGLSPDFGAIPGEQFALVTTAPVPGECAGDVNSDGSTNAADFTILAGNFGASVAPNTGGDLNGDGTVNAADFTILAGDFGCAE
jgi:glycosidase